VVGGGRRLGGSRARPVRLQMDRGAGAGRAVLLALRRGTDHRVHVALADLWRGDDGGVSADRGLVDVRQGGPPGGVARLGRIGFARRRDCRGVHAEHLVGVVRRRAVFTLALEAAADPRGASANRRRPGCWAGFAARPGGVSRAAPRRGGFESAPRGYFPDRVADDRGAPLVTSLIEEILAGQKKLTLWKAIEQQYQKLN